MACEKGSRGSWSPVLRGLTRHHARCDVKSGGVGCEEVGEGEAVWVWGEGGGEGGEEAGVGVAERGEERVGGGLAILTG